MTYLLQGFRFDLKNHYGKKIKMRLISDRQRLRDVLRTLRDRRVGGRKSFYNPNIKEDDPIGTKINKWVEREIRRGLNIEIKNGRRVSLKLPVKMNFSSEYDATMRCMTAIRIMSFKKGYPSHAYRLGFVDFSGLKEISTSAALALTAELSKWDDIIRQRLRPKVETWNKKILTQFSDIGFFDLFKNKASFEIEKRQEQTSLRFVKYIKGQSDDADKTQELKEEINRLIGEDINKWTFLYSGLSEAITNVCHHAYPQEYDFPEVDKNWYMTGSYDSLSKVLKVAFYDQGIGIPESLPSSILYEKVLDYLKKAPIIKGMRDATFLKAAVEIERTRTGDDDRGKGLQDLLEFNNQRGEGYLSILSGRGLYKYTVSSGRDTVKSERLPYPVLGTLIIWSTML
ncbi:Uncharacterised protein [Serratia quinivorans]|uniref:hypothetical protein n=1 Tax=Serratia quinivorans TaxID=137545 RepID=UPI00217A18A9|nr:hypothetical protein [Serratia quinivorans]CAI1056956.1 Uncharacterised protein [Serratia quinivorans]CAI1072325.1 Uncharacterised protein [Serratia quinivorans]CAI1874897.1 Uncharacterised protein [Serratia quinivorans]CAI2122879.1 Uncharacterised protein [Serratia quinivorans]CAI2489441.1 Uncharacterised protein [Serratia quinivorans]